MSERYVVAHDPFNAPYILNTETDLIEVMFYSSVDDSRAIAIANLLNKQADELREAQADAAVLQEALEYYGVLYDSAFRTHKSGVELLRELDDLRTALKEIHTLTLDLTVQSRLSAAEPGSKISNICLHALGLITDEEFEAAKGE